MLLMSDRLIASASDLAVASQCEYGWLCRLEELRERRPKTEAAEDALLARAAQLGERHEQAVLDHYRARHGDAVVTIVRPERGEDARRAAAQQTVQALEQGAPVVYQAAFLDEDSEPGFLGFADFIVRQRDGRYRVEDTKLARSAKVTALLQLAAYAAQLGRLGIGVDPLLRLRLGDGSVSDHALADIAPVFALRWQRLRELAVQRESEATAGLALQWGDPRWSICGQCPHCETAIAQHDDVLQVATLRRTQRARLAQAGIRTMQELAGSSGAVDGIGHATLDNLRAQARLQCQPHTDGKPAVEWRDSTVLNAVPAPNDGDLFFDFEGDPLHNEGGEQWGLDYLFGVMEASGEFRAFWAHDFAQERQALKDFLDYVTARRRHHPDLRIYHYAAYERTHLASLAARHGLGEDIVDQLFREHVLVDLYSVVRKALRVGSPSYSIKKLEPLYMDEAARDAAGVANAAESIAEYARAVELRDAGDEAGFDAALAAIKDYNRYDCLSTLKLRDWLLANAPSGAANAAAANHEPNERQEAAAEQRAERSALSERLLSKVKAVSPAQRDADDTALALAAAAVGYHEREAKKTWWEHYSRLEQPIDEWDDQRGVFMVEAAEVISDWATAGRQRVARRQLRLVGQAAPGSSFDVSERSNAFLLYEPGPQAPASTGDPGSRIARNARITHAGEGLIEVEESLSGAESPYAALPMALTPGPPINTNTLREAIAEWATVVDAHGPGWPRNAACDLLRRQPPNLKHGAALPAVTNGDVGAAMLAALHLLDDSCLAVQGPPGTGKTHTGAEVIRQLVESGWKVGVTAQSHAVIDNFLRRALASGLDPARIAHVRGVDGSPCPAIQSNETEQWIAGQPGGLLLGATAWAFSNARQVPRQCLDLLVIDEAGQYSLANSIAVSVAARNLLLLGDPQQLPQVTQGAHPEPVDASALGWFAAGNAVLPEHLGYFLPHTFRMDEALTRTVSRLSYAGRLHSAPATCKRRLDGIEPGLHPVAVTHAGNATESGEEAAKVVATIRDLLGRRWTNPSANRQDDPLCGADIIVITPYNAQRAGIEKALLVAGIDGVRVGTVDKFQGQEAVVCLVSLAASSASDVPRGMDFLIDRNRLNVAISRAQWAAWLFHSPGLLDHLPATPVGLARLGAFAGLARPELA